MYRARQQGEEPRDSNVRRDIEDRRLPDRRHSIAGFTDEGLRIYANTSIARKLYKCAVCTGAIAIGAEHTVVESLQAVDSYDHHHLHDECFLLVYLPKLGRLAVINSAETSRKKMGRRRHR